ncbi:IPT/TIG domain-containing protein [Brevundimonas sp. NPDC055320]
MAAPTVSSVTPKAGPTAGGALVSISGSGFLLAQPTGAVKIGATNATYTIQSDTRIRATTPANAAGTYDITVTTPSGTSATSSADQYTYVAPPTVSSISPAAGPTTAGTKVTIIGTNFTHATGVTFGEKSALGYAVNSDTQITATAPAGTGTVDIRVTTAGGAVSAADQYTYVAAPTVTSISPATGLAAGGTTVTITGTNFSGATRVTFGGTAASYTVNSDTQITATAPAGTGTVNVQVRTAGGTSAASSADQYTYAAAPTVASLSPRAGPTAGGTIVTITGTNFTNVKSVMFGGTAALAYAVTSSNQITAAAPAGTGTVDVQVTTAGGTSATSLADQYTYAPAPVASAASASVGYETPQAIDLSGVITGIHTSIGLGSWPAHGAVAVAGDVIIYTPAPLYYGPDSFTYTATGPGGTSAPATVTVTVAAPSAPVAAAASAGVGYETPQAIDLSGVVTGVHTSIAVASGPAHGAVAVAGDVITYTPKPLYYGPDSFTYTAAGPGGTSAPATVTVTVATPSPPVVEQPTDPVMAPHAPGGGSVSVNLSLISQGAIDGYRITGASRFGVAEIIDSAAASTLKASAAPKAARPYQLTYKSAANFMGTDTVNVVAYGPGGDSAPATFTFLVAGKAPDLSAQVTSGASVTFMPTAALVGDQFQGLRITRAPDFGTVTVNGLSLVFTPGVNGGATSLDYVIELPFGASAPGRIDLTADALPASAALVAQTLQGAPVTVRISDVEGGPFTAAATISMGPTAAGEASIAKVGNDYDLTFVSIGDFTGEAIVSYSLSNAFGTTRSTLTVTVEARPDPSLDPEVRGVATSQVTSARRFADAQINNFQQRLRDLHDGTNASSNGLSLNLGLGGADADRDPRQALRRQLGLDRRLDPDALGDDRERDMLGLDLWAGRMQLATPTAASDDRLNTTPQSANDAGAPVGLWTAGSVDWGRQDATGQSDSRFTTQGLTVGLDVKISNQLIVGAGVGYGEDKTRIGDNGSLTLGQAVTGAFYASWRPAEAFYVDGLVGYADLDFTSRRWAAGLAGQADSYAEGDRSGDVRFASVALGRVQNGERVARDLYARLDARDISLDGFVETGSGLSALSWDEIQQKSLSVNLGASWRWTLDIRRHGQFRPSARIEWSHELEDIGEQGVRYADWTTSPTYLVPLNAWSRNVLNLALENEWSLSERLMLNIGYRGAFGDASISHGAQFGMKYGW